MVSDNQIVEPTDEELERLESLQVKEAAPELMEACEALVSWWNSTEDYVYVIPWPGTFTDAVNKAKAALAKAKGQ